MVFFSFLRFSSWILGTGLISRTPTQPMRVPPLPSTLASYIAKPSIHLSAIGSPDPPTNLLLAPSLSPLVSSNSRPYSYILFSISSLLCDSSPIVPYIHTIISITIFCISSSFRVSFTFLPFFVVRFTIPSSVSIRAIQLKVSFVSGILLCDVL